MSTGSLFNVALTELAQLDKSDLDGALRRIVELDAQVLRVARVSYWELSPDHATITCRVLYTVPSGEFVQGAQLHARDVPAYFRALLQSQAIVADDAWTDPRTAEFVEPYFRAHDIRSMLDVPVWRRGKLAGVLCHENVGSVRAWNDDEQAFAVGVGNMVSVALESGDRRRAEEGYELVARATNDVLWDWDFRRDVVEWNEALYSVFRYHPGDVRPSVSWWREHVHPDDRERVWSKLSSVVASQAIGYTDQYRWLRGDGTTATVIDRGHIVRDREGKAVRMVGSMLDITERVEMQSRVELSDRMASIGTLAAGVAHEINNPLTYVLANLTIALEDLKKPDCDTAALQDLIRDAHEGAERVRRIVRDLHVLSRPEEDDVQMVDVQPVIESSLNMVSNQLRHRARVVKDYGPLPAVRVNRARIGQVMLNLLVNAAHAIKEGNALNNVVRIRTFTSEQGEAVLEVSDSGCGISADVQRRMFEPFFTTKAVGFGTGLGLSICHSIVTAAGGRIDVESTVGSGTRMRIILPPAEPAAPARPASSHEGPSRRVLLVDDEPMILRAVTRMLEPHHQVTVADSGDSALSEMERHEFDLILCDLMMPKMTGMELYKHLVAEGSPFADRIVFMTGGAFSRDSSEFMRMTDRPFLDKPLDRASLARAFSAVSDRASVEP